LGDKCRKKIIPTAILYYKESAHFYSMSILTKMSINHPDLFQVTDKNYILTFSSTAGIRIKSSGNMYEGYFTTHLSI